MTLRFGVLGASRIAPTSLVAPAQRLGIARVVSIAARDRDRAEAFAREHGVQLALRDYDDLLAHRENDAIYNALPVSHHADLTIAALKLGKHVLCEKPFAMSGREARAMVREAESRGLILMEAFHYRYHPMFVRLLEAVAAGEIGAVRRIEAVFHATVEPAPGEIRFDPRLGGGALGDFGSYCVHWARSIAWGEPEVVFAEQAIAPTGVDISTHALLRFPGGVTADISCDMAREFSAYVLVEGETGRIRAVNPLVPHHGHALHFETQLGSRVERLTVQPSYDFQLKAFCDAVKCGTPPLTSGADTIGQMETLDRIRDTARATTGRTA